MKRLSSTKFGHMRSMVMCDNCPNNLSLPRYARSLPVGWRDISVLIWVKPPDYREQAIRDMMGTGMDKKSARSAVDAQYSMVQGFGGPSAQPDAIQEQKRLHLCPECSSDELLDLSALIRGISVEVHGTPQAE